MPNMDLRILMMKEELIFFFVKHSDVFESVFILSSFRASLEVILRNT